MSEFKGYINKYCTVWCGRCIRWDDVPVNRNPSKQAKLDGWKTSKEFGWLCPECVLGITKDWHLRNQDI